MVEFGLIGTMFFGLLIGTADLGQFLFVQEALVQRVTAAARLGAVTDPANNAAIQNMVLYTQSTAPVNAQPSFGLTPTMVAVSTPDAGTDNYRLVVQVSGYSYKLISPYLAGTYRGTPITASVPLGSYH